MISNTAQTLMLQHACPIDPEGILGCYLRGSEGTLGLSIEGAHKGRWCGYNWRCVMAARQSSRSDFVLRYLDGLQRTSVSQQSRLHPPPVTSMGGSAVSLSQRLAVQLKPIGHIPLTSTV